MPTAFSRRYDRDGKLIWSRKVGGSLEDRVGAADTDAVGNTLHRLWAAFKATGEEQGYLSKYSASGSLLWTRKTAGNGRGESPSSAFVAVDPLGGYTLPPKGSLVSMFHRDTLSAEPRYGRRPTFLPTQVLVSPLQATVASMRAAPTWSSTRAPGANSSARMVPKHQVCLRFPVRRGICAESRGRP
jgi:hypothetical protein